MKKLALVIFMLLVALFPAQADAQTTDWEVVAFDTRQPAIVTFGPEGLRETIVVPERTGDRVALSPNRRYLAYEQSGTGSTYGEYKSIRVYNVQEQTCCTEIGLEIDMAQEGYTSSVRQLIGFHPENPTHLALIYQSSPDDAPAELPYDPSTYGLMIFDMESQSIIAHVEIGRLPNTVRWMGDTLVWAEAPDTMEGDFPPLLTEAPLKAWNPSNAEEIITVPQIGVTPDHGGSVVGEMLEGTGEYIVRSYVDLAPDEDALMAVLRYQSDAMGDSAPLILVDPLDTFMYSGPDPVFKDAEWVADGSAIYTHFNDNMGDVAFTLLMRDGTKLSINTTVQHFFLTGTPDGWLSFDSQSAGVTQVMHYRLIEGAIESSLLAEITSDSGFGGDLKVLWRTPLGATIDPTPFPEVPIPSFLG